jgi:hypothetical protein
LTRLIKDFLAAFRNLQPGQWSANSVSRSFEPCRWAVMRTRLSQRALIQQCPLPERSLPALMLQHAGQLHCAICVPAHMLCTHSMHRLIISTENLQVNVGDLCGIRCLRVQPCTLTFVLAVAAHACLQFAGVQRMQAVSDCKVTACLG